MAEKTKVDVLHAMSQADAALRIAGLPADEIFRTELAEAIRAVAEVLRCANGLQNALDLRHPTKVVNNWRKSLNDALYAAGHTGQQGAASHG